MHSSHWPSMLSSHWPRGSCICHAFSYSPLIGRAMLLGSHGSTCLGLGSPCLGSHGVALASHALAWPAHALSLPRQALPPKNNPKSRKEATWHGVGSPCLLLACCQLPTVCTPRAQNVHFGPPAKLAHAIFDFSVPKFILTPLEGFPSNQTPMPQEFYFLRFSQFFGFKK
jgi:hypothetical protein